MCRRLPPPLRTSPSIIATSIAIAYIAICHYHHCHMRFRPPLPPAAALHASLFGIATVVTLVTIHHCHLLPWWQLS